VLQERVRTLSLAIAELTREAKGANIIGMLRKRAAIAFRWRCEIS
jgi:hypothetical protein